MKKLLDISSEERNRILEMHQTATRKNYLTEAPQQTASPQQAAGKATFNPSTRLIFTGKDGRVYGINVAWTDDQAKMRQYSEMIKGDEMSKYVNVEIPDGTYNSGDKAFGSFYLLSYEIGQYAMGGKPGMISSFAFTPDPNWVKKYGQPVVTLDYSKPILGYKNSDETKGYIGGMPVSRTPGPTQFVLHYTTPTKKIDVSSDSGEKAVLIGTAVIKTNDTDNPEKKIYLKAKVGTQFGVPKTAPTSEPTQVTSRT
jgi:hypothetical protein